MQVRSDLIKAQQEAMRPFAFLAGDWEGVKSAPQPDGSTAVTRSRDVGRVEVGGAVFTVAGQGFAPGGAEPELENFGVFSFDVEARTYVVQTYANGLIAQGAVKVLNDGSIEVMPQGPDSSFRLLMTPQTADSWRELGEMRDEVSDAWRPFFDIEFKRVG